MSLKLLPKNGQLSIPKTGLILSLKPLKSAIKSNIRTSFELLKIGCTLPVTSSECERSFSAMRRLRTWLRANMTTERLGSLAIMNIHYNEKIEYKQVSKLFFFLAPKKIV